MRRVLVVFQFTVSIVLIVGTVVVFRQRQFIRTKNLGFNKDQVLVVSKAYLLTDHAETLKEEMRRFPAVAGATLSSFVPVPPSSTINAPVSRDGDPAPLKANPINVWIVDPEFVDTLQMKIAAGRNFSRRFPTDSSAILVNQSAARYFGLVAPLGQRLNIARPDERSPERALISTASTIVGVLEDFHFQSLRSSIAPLVVRMGRSRGNLILRIKPGGVAAAVDALKTKWNAFLPGEPMDYSFLDERFAALYRSELRVGRVFGVFAGLAVFIGCLGLFGMAAYAASKRAREIAIHKVLGANAAEIVRLLVRESLLLVAAANLIAWPVAYGVMSKWLGGFAYRTGIGWAVFALTGGLTLLIALLTVGFQSIKASTVDPAVVLRSE